jgi:hypothetical protein
MPAEVITNRVLPAQAQEVILIVDDYGTEFSLNVPISDSANRQTRIDAAVAQQSANQTALEAYATAHGIDLTAQKAAGTAKKNQLKGTA